MPGLSPHRLVPPLVLILLTALALGGCNAGSPPPAPRPASEAPKPEPTPAPTVESSPAAPTIVYPPVAKPAPAVLLGIDVLAAQNFSALQGKRVGLLTHPPGVNRFGVSTVDVLRRATNVKLVALFGPEHGIYGTASAGENIADTLDKRTGLPAYSLYGKNRKPTKQQLKGINALVIDLQDIGVRSYTFSVCMKYAIEACFENGVEVIVLDRPNPLGGLKVDGPILDRPFFSGVGQFAMPYVHGLTMGELARLAAGTPGALDIPEKIRAQGRLTVIPMSGWRRSMRWRDTGLTFVPTSPKIQDVAACEGYAMTGLGCQLGGFVHGVGEHYWFRGLHYPGKPIELVQRELTALHAPGLTFSKVSVPNKTGQPGIGLYVEITDWDDWRPAELGFHLMRLAAKFSNKNPFAAATSEQAQLFNKHTGSLEWWNALRRDGARVDLEAFIAKWRRDALAFQQTSRKFWLYN